MVGFVLIVRASVRFQCFGKFMGLVWFCLELVSWCDVRVTARLCLGIWICWGRP